MTASDEFLRVIVSNLKAMNEEAKPLPDGTPTGLWWYHRHLQGSGPKPKKYRNEERMFEELKNRLKRYDPNACCEVGYPRPASPRKRGRSRSCDIVMQWEGFGRIWLEVKCAWRHENGAGTIRNSAYRPHLLRAADDLRKLETLTPDAADSIAFLLIGFDQKQAPMTAGELAVVYANAKHKAWSQSYQEWDDAYRIHGRIRVWLWSRPTATNAALSTQADP